MIDPKIQEQLRQKYNPDGSPLRQHQLKLLEMLVYFDKVCKENSIHYWLSSGTCLGAVRHGGFIPWDDDLDVEMMREDYLKLEKIFHETDDYILQTWKNDLFYTISFAKLRDKHSVVYDSLCQYRGYFIDIFALEYTARPISFITSYLHKFFGGHLYNCMKRLKKENRLVLKMIFYFLLLFFIVLKYSCFYTVPLFRLCGKFFKQKKLRHQYGVGFINNIRNEKEIFPLKYIRFEGYLFPIPHNYDNYLQHLYGNYMKLPDDNYICASFHQE